MQLTTLTNGKLERYHRTIKVECIRPGTPLSLEDARRIVTDFVSHYNEVRLHSAIGYVTPLDKMLGREQEIFDQRDRKLEAARERRAEERQQARSQQTASRENVIVDSAVDLCEGHVVKSMIAAV